MIARLSRANPSLIFEVPSRNEPQSHSSRGFPRFICEAPFPVLFSPAFVVTMAGAKPLPNRRTAFLWPLEGQGSPEPGAGSYRAARTGLDASAGQQMRALRVLEGQRPGLDSGRGQITGTRNRTVEPNAR